MNHLQREKPAERRIVRSPSTQRQESILLERIPSLSEDPHNAVSLFGGPYFGQMSESMAPGQTLFRGTLGLDLGLLSRGPPGEIANENEASRACAFENLVHLGF